VQTAATKLKSLTAGGKQVKIVAVGIGGGVYREELNNVASHPRDANVILVAQVINFHSVLGRLKDTICYGQS